MSTATAVTVPITQAAYAILSDRAKEEGLTVSEVLEETIREAAERREVFRRMREAMEQSQAAAVLNGTSTMTMDEINEEIELMHRERAALRKSA